MRVCSYPGCVEQARSPRARYCQAHADALRIARIREWQKSHPDQHLANVHRYRDRKRQGQTQEQKQQKLREVQQRALQDYVKFFGARTGQ
jgi:hypothetical protein